MKEVVQVMLENEHEVYDFGQRLRKLREAMKLTQEDAARMVGVSKDSLYRYENNTQDPSLKTLVRFALCYNTSIDYLAGLSDTVSIVVHGLDSRESQILRDFVSCFVEQGRD